MKLAVDVDYRDDGPAAVIAGVAFDDWGDDAPTSTYLSAVASVAEYEPGSFYKRELPCLLALLREHALRPELIVIDGFVYLDDHERPGLGAHLHRALGGAAAVVGVAKKPFRDIGQDCAVYRGESKKPLFVTAAGIGPEQAKAALRAMHGAHRMPTLLRLVDRLCRDG